MLSRRSFFFGASSAVAAPFVVKFDNLMPIKSLAIRPTWVGEDLVLCDGAELSRTAFADLFRNIGTTFGEGNGVSTFTLPPSYNTDGMPSVMFARHHSDCYGESVGAMHSADTGIVQLPFYRAYADKWQPSDLVDAAPAAWVAETQQGYRGFRLYRGE